MLTHIVIHDEANQGEIFARKNVEASQSGGNDLFLMAKKYLVCCL